MGWGWVVILIAMLFLTLSCAQPAFPLPPPSGVPAAEDTASEPTRRPGHQAIYGGEPPVRAENAWPAIIDKETFCKYKR